MRVENLDIPQNAIEFLHNNGFITLYPPQEKSVKAGLLEGNSILISAPTASGKTLIAILAIIKHLLGKKGKIVYLSPLKALASEKFSEFKKLELIDFGRKIRTQISTGDYDQTDKNLGQNDILVLTNEKMDFVITKLKILPQKPQILALSATVTNADEISNWLGCKLVQIDWRPVPLWQGVYDHGTVTMQDRKNFEVEASVRDAPVDL